MGDDAAAIVRAFIERINTHDPEGVIGCCTTDHRFAGSAGTVMSGGEALDRAWRAYFNLFPDYGITIECAVLRRPQAGGPDVARDVTPAARGGYCTMPKARSLDGECRLGNNRFDQRLRGNPCSH